MNSHVRTMVNSLTSIGSTLPLGIAVSLCAQRHYYLIMGLIIVAAVAVVIGRVTD